MEIQTPIENNLVKIQLKLKNEIKKVTKLTKINTVAGVDLAYFKDKGIEYAVCVIAVIEYNTKQLLGYVSEVQKIECPYIHYRIKLKQVRLE